MYSRVVARLEKSKPGANTVVLAFLGFCIYGLIATAKQWHGPYRSGISLDLSLAMLPLYATYSLFRALTAYLLSLSFTLVFGYLAAKVKIAEKLIVPLLDIGQSIPVLGFLPSLVLGLLALFPDSNVGLELACIIMIFTGQVWNMTFSFISSLKSIPKELYEMTENLGLSRFQTLLRLELPCSATGLAWNSLMSMAGGWFFLTVCEAFILGDQNFRVPGLGSYMAVAIENNNTQAIGAGIATMIGLIVMIDFVVWRPVIAWTGRFRLSESNDSLNRNIPFVSLLLSEASVFKKMAEFSQKFFRLRSEKKRAMNANSAILLRSTKRQRSEQPIRISLLSRMGQMGRTKGLAFAIKSLVALFVALIAIKLYALVSVLGFGDWQEIFLATGLTFLRVIGAVILGSLWAIPVGILIGLSPRLTRLLQPVVQIGASFPAPMLYPIALAFFQLMHLSLSVSASLLMLLGVQWYILFNVLAGAVGISQDLRESFKSMSVSKKSHWLRLYLPSIYPSLVTGLVTAAGGAWNASIVSEYLIYKGEVLKTRGLGAMISQATSQGNFSLLAACLMVMAFTVVFFNRFVWSRLYETVETRFRFER